MPIEADDKDILQIAERLRDSLSQWAVYLLKFDDGEFYVGKTTNLKARISCWRYWYRKGRLKQFYRQRGQLYQFTWEVLEIGSDGNSSAAEMRWMAYYIASGATLKNRIKPPKLTREECDDIRRMYADRTRNIQPGDLARLFRVSQATILDVLFGRYISRDELGIRSQPEPPPRQPINREEP